MAKDNKPAKSTMEIVVDNDQTNQGIFNKADVQVMQERGIIPPGTPHGHIKAFLYTCKEKQLSPFSSQIYLLGYYSKANQKYEYSVIVGIDGYRKKAHDTQLYAGKSEAMFNKEPNGNFNTLAQECAKFRKDKNYRPLTCTITVYKAVGAIKAEFTATIAFDEFDTGKQKWRTMPFQMIMKACESHALRMAFSELSGLHTEAEIGAFEDNQPHAQVVQDIDVEVELSDEHLQALQEIQQSVEQIQDIDELLKFFQDNPQWNGNDKFCLEVIRIFNEHKQHLITSDPAQAEKVKKYKKNNG